MAKCLKCDELKERVAALEEENRQLREGLGGTGVLFDGKQIVEELRRSEEKYRIIADFTYDWEMWMRPSGDYLYISPSCERITGYLAEEFMTDPSLFWRILHPDDLARVEKHYRDAAESSGQIHSIDFRLIHRSGEERWVNHYCQPVYGRDMRFLCRRVSNRDITERKRREDDLRESEIRYRTLFDSIDEGFCVVEVIFNESGKAIDYRFLVINQAFEKRTGLIDAQGKRMRELAPQHEEHWFEIYGRVALTGQPVRFQNRAEQLSRWYDVYAFRYDQPEKRQVAILFSDITERKRLEDELRMSEERYRRVVEDQTEVICRFREDGTFTFVNEVFCLCFGKSSDELIGKKWQDLAIEEDLPLIEAKLRSLSPADPVVVIENRATTGDSQICWMQFVNRAFFDAEGRLKEIQSVGRDITERKQAEEAFRESEEKYRSLFENMLDGFAYCRMIFDEQERPVDFVYLNVNRAFERLTGLENVVGKRATEVIPGIKELSPELLEIYGRVALTGKPERFEFDFKPLELWLSISLYSTRKGHFVAVFNDITKRRRAEMALRESEKKYRTLFEMESDALLLVDDETLQILDANAAAVALFQYSREELRARTVLDVSSEPEKILQVMRQRVSRIPQRWLLKKDGTRFPGEITRRLFEWQGRQVRLAAIRDISERMEAEKELKETRDLLTSALDNTPALVHVNTLDNRYSLVNRSWERFTGKTAQEVLGRNPTALFSAKTARKFHATHRMVIDTKAPVALEEVVWRGHEKFHFHTTLFPLIGSDGEISAIGGISVDISDLKHAEEQLHETREQLFQSQKMETLGTLVAGVAHEINNPISLVLFNAPLLRRIWSDLQPVIERHADVEHQRKYAGLSYEYLKNNLDRLLADMELAGNRIAAIVNHLKEFARKSDISEKNRMSLNEAVENALGFSQMSFRKAGVRLNVALGTDLPSMIGNMQRIEQIILNVLVNAVQAIKHKQGLIEIKTSYDEPRGGVTLSVSDNGEGIDPSTSGRIFDPFYTTRQGEGGTGLGLSVTYNLVKEHHGRITFESEVGKGTTFKVFFPLRAEKKRFKVLAIDDEDTFLEILKNAFGKLSSFDLEIAQSGMDALIKIGIFHPDILITDLMMPGMDGLELCRKLRESPELAQTEVVVVTGFLEDPKLETIRELGFTRIYRKPLDLEAFMKEIERIVDGEESVGSRQ